MKRPPSQSETIPLVCQCVPACDEAYYQRRIQQLEEQVATLIQCIPKQNGTTSVTESILPKTATTDGPIESVEVEVNLDDFNESIQANYDFKQDVVTLADQRYIKYSSGGEARKAAKRIRERFKQFEKRFKGGPKGLKYSSIKIKKDGDKVQLIAGVSLIVKK